MTTNSYNFDKINKYLKLYWKKDPEAKKQLDHFVQNAEKMVKICKSTNKDNFEDIRQAIKDNDKLKNSYEKLLYSNWDIFNRISEKTGNDEYVFEVIRSWAPKFFHNDNMRQCVGFYDAPEDSESQEQEPINTAVLDKVEAQLETIKDNAEKTDSLPTEKEQSDAPKNQESVKETSDAVGEVVNETGWSQIIQAVAGLTQLIGGGTLDNAITSYTQFIGAHATLVKSDPTKAIELFNKEHSVFGKFKPVTNFIIKLAGKSQTWFKIFSRVGQAISGYFYLTAFAFLFENICNTVQNVSVFKQSADEIAQRIKNMFLQIEKTLSVTRTNGKHAFKYLDFSTKEKCFTEKLLEKYTSSIVNNDLSTEYQKDAADKMMKQYPLAVVFDRNDPTKQEGLLVVDIYTNEFRTSDEQLLDSEAKVYQSDPFGNRRLVFYILHENASKTTVATVYPTDSAALNSAFMQLFQDILEHSKENSETSIKDKYEADGKTCIRLTPRYLYLFEIDQTVTRITNTDVFKNNSWWRSCWDKLTLAWKWLLKCVIDTGLNMIHHLSADGDTLNKDSYAVTGRFPGIADIVLIGSADYRKEFVDSWKPLINLYSGKKSTKE